MATAATLPAADAVADVALTGTVAGTLYFATGSAALPNDAGLVVAEVHDVAAAQPQMKLLISGFHDDTGGAAANALLAKERAKGVREALVAAGVDGGRIVMRKPELMVGGGDDAQARRVEVRATE